MTATVPQLAARLDDEQLWGWDPTPGIVSVWADRLGEALVWQRDGAQVRCTRERFRPWVYAATLADLAYLGKGLAAEEAEADDAAVTYRLLDGPSDSYCYLISARPGFALERTLLAGASRRIGRRVSSLYDLEDTYYRVGAVEQYLMQTGRVYFRGLHYSDLHRLQFDLETTALDPNHGRIFLVAIRDSRGLGVTLEARTAADEARLIGDLLRLIRERDPDVIENHNLFGFDLPFLKQRAALHGIPLTLNRPEGPPHHQPYPDPYAWGDDEGRKRFSVAGREMVDTLDAVRRYDFAARDLPSHGLKAVARHFGVAAPDRVYLAGADVYPTYQSNPELVRSYALHDVAEVDALSQRLQGVPWTLAGMAPRCYERIASAGPAMGILEPMLVRAYLRAGAALPRQLTDRSAEDGLHAGGTVSLFATGVAQHVVKADVASLYPSIMRTFQIGPACDRLGVLLHLVNRLTDLRLAHKAAAHDAPLGSLEAGLHHGNQAAMKILINSAYGYLGAGSMALFADRRAADEVTRRGRELLDQVVEGLRQRGMALIEADTDGVYFAVPTQWGEAQERGLVAEVAATLPAGIRLEYEGRYQAMFSHEVKNYALLTYDGELIVRGVALRSSRAEPYGEAFLRQALRCTLLGDVTGVQRAFLDMAQAIRDRALPVAELAAPMRLSKTPDAYMQARNSHREHQYEALLAAGRTQWRRGERVRIYRKEGGTVVLLPESNEAGLANSGETSQAAAVASEDQRDYDVEYYLQLLKNSYAGRLRKAFAPHEFEQIFRVDAQLGLFDCPVDQMQPLWIRCLHESGEPPTEVGV